MRGNSEGPEEARGPCKGMERTMRGNSQGHNLFTFIIAHYGDDISKGPVQKLADFCQF